MCHRTNSRRAALATALLWLAACTAAPAPASPDSTPPPAEPFHLQFQPLDADLAAALTPVLDEGVRTVERFFGAPFAHDFTITIHPDRAAFDASFPPEWGVAKSECWMVASGVADGVQVLSPRVWASEACGHDPGDAGHVARLLTHELVHVYHGQRNPSPDFVDVTGIDWFVEGLATLASGQLAAEHASAAREALANGQGPRDLASAWSGRARYGVAGSLVACVEHELGHARLRDLLGASSGDELLDRIGMSEEELLTRWRAFVPSGAPQDDDSARAGALRQPAL